MSRIASRASGTGRRGVLRALGLGVLLPFGTRGTRAGGPYDRGLLWRVERPGVAASHLFGTVHLGDPRVLALQPAVQRALDGAASVWLEMLDDPRSAQVFAAASRLDDGRTLADLAGEATASRVLGVLGSRYGMPPSVAQTLQPWAAYLALSQPTRAPGEILDASLRRRARQRGVPVLALETVEEQIASLQALEPTHQIALLDALARRHDESLAAIDTLLELYLAEDLAGMLALQRAGIDGEPRLNAAFEDLIDHLLVRRNARMVERMQSALREGGAFVAMGALHLQGVRGLPARLTDQGWKVRNLPLG